MVFQKSIRFSRHLFHPCAKSYFSFSKSYFHSILWHFRDSLGLTGFWHHRARCRTGSACFFLFERFHPLMTKGTWLPFSQRDTIRFSWEFSTMFSCSEALFSFVGHFLKSWGFHWFPASQAWEHPCLVPSHHHPMFLLSFFGGVACLSLLFFLPVFRLFGAERRGREGK